MSATAKFYTGFGVAVLLVVLISGFAGYLIGQRRTSNHGLRSLASYNACLTEIKRTATASKIAANAKLWHALLSADDCAHVAGIPFFSPRDIYDMTAVHIPVDPTYSSAAWAHPENPRRAQSAFSGSSGLRSQ